MLFNSVEFILVFLPVSLVGYHIIRALTKQRFELLWLVAMSLFFYSWWNITYLPLILLSIIFNYAVGGILSSSYTYHFKKLILACGVSANICLLGYFKYANFFVDNINTIFGSDMHLSLIVLPLAISFFTFQQIAYLVDAYKGELTNNGFVSYCLFVTFFPQLIAGPIVHNKEMLPQFKKGGSSRFKVDDISIGSTIFLIGLFKKTVFADNVAAYATPVFKLADSGGELMFLEAWIGAISYSLQLYFDFSGYADMAIGAGRMFGIYLPANFDSPYKATNIIDFWKKWHMTLSRFLRDYVYIAMGGNRKGNTRRAINLFLTMLIGGLWHGAGWTFVVWGGIHGVLLLVNHSWRVLYGKANFTIKLPQRFFSLMSFSLTIFIVVIAWVFFRAESLDGANNMLKTMFGMNGIVLPHQLQSILYDPYFISFSSGAFGTIAGISAMMWIFVLSAIVFIAPNTQQIMENYKPTYEYLISDKKCRPTRYSWRPNLLFAIIMAIVSVISISFVFMAERSEFLYFQF